MGNVAARITYSIYDSLIRRDFLADGSGTASRLVPGLAESWTHLDDARRRRSCAKAPGFMTARN